MEEDLTLIKYVEYFDFMNAQPETLNIDIN